MPSEYCDLWRCKRFRGIGRLRTGERGLCVQVLFWFLSESCPMPGLVTDKSKHFVGPEVCRCALLILRRPMVSITTVRVGIQAKIFFVNFSVCVSFDEAAAPLHLHEKKKKKYGGMVKATYDPLCFKNNGFQQRYYGGARWSGSIRRFMLCSTVNQGILP